MARILCVDDEPHVASLQCLLLAAEGHCATPVWTVFDALDELRSKRYDLVITRWRLCDGGGDVIVATAKALAPAPAVVVSGHIQDGGKLDEPPADLYLKRVIDPDELVAIVHRIL